MTVSMAPVTYDLRTVSEVTGLGQGWLRRLVRSRQLPAETDGRDYRVTDDDLRDFIRTRPTLLAKRYFSHHSATGIPGRRDVRTKVPSNVGPQTIDSAHTNTPAASSMSSAAVEVAPPPTEVGDGGVSPARKIPTQKPRSETSAGKGKRGP